VKKFLNSNFSIFVVNFLSRYYQILWSKNQFLEINDFGKKTFKSAFEKYQNKIQEIKRKK